MRVALISDIHGNLVALDAVLADLEREQVDQIVCLGDVAEAAHTSRCRSNYPGSLRQRDATHRVVGERLELDCEIVIQPRTQ